MSSPAISAENPAPISVVVADKSSLVRVGLRGLLEEDERFELVSLAADGAEFLELIKECEFQVAVIGWAMPGVDGRGVLRALRERPIAARIVVYTGHPNEDVPRQVMALGGAGFCWKSEPPSQLLETVASVAHGQMVFPYVDVRVLHASPLASLTARERELLAALSRGRAFRRSPSRRSAQHSARTHCANVPSAGRSRP